MGEIVRGKALALVLESATVTDTNGAAVDLSDLRDDAADTSAAGAPFDLGDGEDHDEHEGHDHEGHQH
jgi:trigger factor